MPRMSQQEWTTFLIDQARTGKLAVTRRDGAPHVTPIWFAMDGDVIVFNTGKDSIKGRAIRHDPRVALCVDDERPPFDFVTMEGTVEISEEPNELRRWAGIIGGRYMGADRAVEFGTRNGGPGELLVRLTPTKVVAMKRIAD
jgi:PPOX class probable F420-dependent enzyme